MLHAIIRRPAQILSLLVPFIKADLQINDTFVGLLQGFSFALFYAVMGLPLGRVWRIRPIAEI